jgi:hypothetical protein
MPLLLQSCCISGLGPEGLRHGHADMSFSSSTLYANFRHNEFTGVRFTRFNAAYLTLKVVDLSYNNISQDSLESFDNIPPNIQELILSSYQINVNLSNPFPLRYLTRFAMANNNIDGNLPDFPDSSPLLREIDLSNQRGQIEGV